MKTEKKRKCWRRVLLAVAGALLPVALQAQVNIGGRACRFDAASGLLLCPVSASAYGADYVCAVSLDADSAWRALEIEHTPVPSGSVYRFARMDGRTDYAFTALRPDGRAVEGHIAFTSLPLVSLDGTFGYDYSEGLFTWLDSAAAAPSPLRARLKWRGGITNTASRHKRNYRVKFVKADGTKKNRSFFGLRSDNDWVLDAAQVDLARCRNRVATDLWLDMASRPYYADRAPEARLGARGDFVELFLNGRYEGVYTLMECVDRKQMQLAEYADGTFHGMLWKASEWTPSTAFGADLPFDGWQESCNGTEVKYPDFDDVCPTDYSTLARAVRFMATAPPEAVADSLDYYFDTDVLRDYFVFLNVVMGVDNPVKNLYWACYDQELSPRLTLAAWDLDATFGQLYTTQGYQTERLGPETDFVNVWTGGSLIGRLDDHPWFVRSTVDRYRELRPGILSTDSVQARFARVFDRLLSSGAARREAQRWSGDTDIHGLQIDLEAERDRVLEWIDRRLAYLDRNFTPSSIQRAEADGSYRPLRGIYLPDGRRLPHTEVKSLPQGFYIVDGQKVVVR